MDRPCDDPKLDPRVIYNQTTVRRLFIAVTLLFAVSLFAKPTGRHKGVGRAKTVHVKSYKTKTGKTVKSYDRAAPSSK
jgi:hypothetical protein